MEVHISHNIKEKGQVFCVFDPLERTTHRTASRRVGSFKRMAKVSFFEGFLSV